MNNKYSTQFKRSHLAGLIALTLTGSSLSLGAYAQETDADEKDLERVLITAERRSVSENEMPLSVIGFSGESLQNRNITDMDRLQTQVPNLQFNDNGNSKFINIRGVGLSEAAPNQTNGVAVHLDGAYVAREFVYGDAFFDLASIEVLRGPQGTYSGQNASGGAIFINSKRPELGVTEGFASAEKGNYDLTKFSAGVSCPVTDNLAMRIAANSERRDSFYSNHGPDPEDDAKLINNQPGNLNRSLSRFQLLYSPSADLEVRLIHENSNNFTDGVPTQNFPEYGNTKLPESPWDLNYDMDTYRDVTYKRNTLTFDWQASDAFKVLGNFSIFDSVQNIQTDGDFESHLTTDESQEGRNFHIVDNYWTGELSLVSTLDGPFEWTAGASYIDYRQENYLNLLRYNTEQFPGTSLDVENHTRLYMYLDNRRKNSAVFGEIGYSLTDDLNVKFGLRYNKDEVGFSPDSYLTPGAGSYNATSGFPLPQQDMFDFSAVTGRFVVNYMVTDDSMIYATVGRGYKPGGTSPMGPTYDEEEVLNKEIGWKGTLTDGIDGSVAIFHMDYDAFQRTYSPTDNPADSITRNVDGTTIAGIEFQVKGITGDFMWDISGAYNDGQYGDLEFYMRPGAYDGVNPTQPEPINLKGRPVDFLSDRSMSAGIEYMGIMLDEAALLPSVRVSYQSEFYTSFYQLDYHLTPSRTLWEANLAYEHDSGWRADLYVQNLFDETYITQAGGAADGRGSFLLGAPRQAGVKIRYTF